MNKIALADHNILIPGDCQKFLVTWNQVLCRKIIMPMIYSQDFAQLKNCEKPRAVILGNVFRS